MVITEDTWRKRILCVVVSLVISALHVCVAGSLIVETTSGTFRGSVQPSGAFAWKGIPFAEPPVGPLRFMSPFPLRNVNRSLIQDATAFKPSCLHYASTGSEDCLYLNVWAPSTPVSGRIPVMVWIVGGSFLAASPDTVDYDGGKLVSLRNSVIVVTLHYRVGPYGYLALPSLSNENPGRFSSGMYGFEDQRAALQWVRSNIAAFGGDPNRVTLFGESAGAIQTCLHIMSPQSSGLFHAAIMESGSCNVVANNGTVRFENGAMFVAYTRCANQTTQPDLLNACLRTLSPSEIEAAFSNSGTSDVFFPSQLLPGSEGFNLPDRGGLSIGQRLAVGSFAPVPVMIGTNRREMSYFAYSDPAIGGMTAATYTSLLRDVWAVDSPELQQTYAVENFPSPKEAFITMASEKFFICPARSAIRSFSRSGAAVFAYSFVHGPRHGALAKYNDTGAFHGAEIPFVFGNLPSSGHLVTSFDPDEQQLSDRMQRFWLNFAESVGNPNSIVSMDEYADMDSMWPQYTSVLEEIMILDVGKKLYGASFAAVYSSRCDLWDVNQIGAYAQLLLPNSACLNCPSTYAPGSSADSSTKGLAIAGIGLAVSGLVVATAAAVGSFLAYRKSAALYRHAN
eukprot:ANDGO_08023.mRNA.1 Para-nitrobenzyl esterase